MLTLPATLLAQETDTTATNDSAAKTSKSTTTSADTTAAATTSGDDDATAGTTTTAEAETERRTRGRHEVRELVQAKLNDMRTEAVAMLQLEPTLLGDEIFMARYPDLADLVRTYPEIRTNPRFYLGDYSGGPRKRTLTDDLMEMLGAGFVSLLIVSALVWLIRTLIEQRRWSRLSRTQAEVHGKLLDRFSSSEEILAYMKTPAGAHFLESAPIPLSTDPTPKFGPVARVIWSVQIGIIVAGMAIGMLVVSGIFTDENRQALFAMGTIALCTGLGFVASAFVSLMLARRLGATAAQVEEPVA